MAPLPLADGRVGCGRCNKSVANMDVLKTHHKAYHRHHGWAACTECTWTRQGRPGDVHDHLESAHDIYRAGHPNRFSTNVNHIKRKPTSLLRRLLAEDRATRAALMGAPPPQAAIPNAWNPDRLALEIRRARRQIMQQPGWQAVVDRQRADRIAQ